MSYSSRVRYKSRQERARRHSRNIKLIILFACIAGVILIFKNWNMLYSYFRTYFY